jgi:hypothetical protein
MLNDMLSLLGYPTGCVPCRILRDVTLDIVVPLFRVVVRPKSSVDISLERYTRISMQGRPTGPSPRGSGVNICDVLLCG